MVKEYVEQIIKQELSPKILRKECSQSFKDNITYLVSCQLLKPLIRFNFLVDQGIILIKYIIKISYLQNMFKTNTNIDYTQFLSKNLLS